jgi:hemerythrin-like domain-containing protein
MKVTDRLLADHKAFRKILEDIDAVVRAPVARREPDRLRKLAALLKRMVLTHAVFEDDVYFPAVKKANAVSPELLAHLAQEHKTIEGYLERLESQLAAVPMSFAWPQTFALLSAGLKGHFKREEEDVFPVSERALGEELLNKLGA